jgi:hypothetical protein
MPQTTQATTCKTALDNVQHGTIYTPDDMQHATGKMHLTTRSVQQTTSRQHAACSGKYAANNKRHATRNRQHAPDFKQHAADNNDVQRNMQHAACNGKRAACKRQRGIWKRPLATGNKATGNKAKCGVQQTPRRRRHNQATHATDNVQHTADDMQEDASTCEMQEKTHGTAAFRVRRAAGSGQAAACAKYCPRQPVRNTAQTPHTRCNIRPVPQHAANTRGTDTTQQALKRTR